MDTTLAFKQPAASQSGGCPRCGVQWDGLPALTLDSLEGKTACRCTDCGTRALTDHALEDRWLYTCNACGIPFRHSDWLSQDAQRCDECDASTPPPTVNGRWLDAIEQEVIEAASRSLSIWDDSTLRGYLNRIAESLSAYPELRMPSKIEVLDLEVWRILSLPSGEIWITKGFLEALQDEAQLAFILAHEMAHLDAEDAAARFIRLGLVPLVREGADDQKLEAALADLSRLGYGRRIERNADEAALRAMIQEGYATRSVADLFKLAEQKYEAGETVSAEWVFAHPPMRDRAIRLEIAEHIGERPKRTPKVNREVFRRVVHGTFSSTHLKRPMKADASVRLPPNATTTKTRSPIHWGWIVGAIGLASLFLWIAFKLNP